MRGTRGLNLAHTAAESPTFRRLDIKIYSPQMRVTAINYFTGSDQFNRALRYYCNHPPPEVEAIARGMRSGATCFKLSDKRFEVCKDYKHPERGANEITVWTEMELFRTLNLAYVPPHMRKFYSSYK